MALSNLHFRNLTKNDFLDMHKAFNLAFSDYIIPISLTFDQFEKRFLQKLDIDFDLSAGAFDGNRLVGFVLTGLGHYDGHYVAYNGGTGVVPSYRGNHLTTHLYRFLLPKLREKKVEKCVLEVINDNETAIHVYKKIGFKESKFFRCFRKSLYDGYEFDEKVVKYIKTVKLPNWELFKSFSDSSPSFLDYYDVLTRNIENEQIIVFEMDHTLLGYAIYQQELGRISQLGVDKRYRRKGVGTALVQYMIKHSDTIALTAMNINSTNIGLIHFFEKLGFVNQLDQFEMHLSLT